MDTFIKPVLGRISGTKTTTTNPYVVITDSVTGLEYFMTRGYMEKMYQIVVTLNSIDLLFEVAMRGEDKLPDEWHEWFEDTYAVGKHLDWSFFTWDFVRVSVKPTVGDSHGKVVLTIALSTL